VCILDVVVVVVTAEFPSDLPTEISPPLFKSSSFHAKTALQGIYVGGEGILTHVSGEGWPPS
jgi:hypothetical protein